LSDAVLFATAQIQMRPSAWSATLYDPYKSYNIAVVPVALAQHVISPPDSV
jgi:hypothetical protein